MKRLFLIIALLFLGLFVSYESYARTIVVQSGNHYNHHHYKKYYSHHHVPASYNISRNWNYHNHVYYHNTVQAYCNQCGHYHPSYYRSCPQPQSVSYYYSEY